MRDAIAGHAALLAQRALHLAGCPRPPKHVHVTHGEPEAADALRQATSEKHRWACSVPDHRESVDVTH